MESSDNVKDYIRAKVRPLADLRAERRQDAIRCHDSIDVNGGVAIGISPTDSILDKYTREELTATITKILQRMRMRGSDGRLVPVAPLSLILVGEYSEKHRWHYHGIIKVNNVVILDSIKRKLRQIVGRTITEEIREDEKYIDYMFKTYLCPEHGDWYVWDREACYTKIER